MIACFLAFLIYPVKAGMSSDARIARMDRTTINSTNVNQFFLFIFLIIVSSRISFIENKYFNIIVALV